MKTIMKKMVLFPLLATLATAPICARAHAEPWFTLGLGWWIVPVAVGGVVLYEIGRTQGESEQHATYEQPRTVYVQPDGGYVQPEKVYIQPTPVYFQQQTDSPQTTYYHQQYGYVIRTPQ
jgi:hypothetical protein